MVRRLRSKGIKETRETKQQDCDGRGEGGRQDFIFDDLLTHHFDFFLLLSVRFPSLEKSATAICFVAGEEKTDNWDGHSSKQLRNVIIWDDICGTWLGRESVFPS